MLINENITNEIPFEYKSNRWIFESNQVWIADTIKTFQLNNVADLIDTLREKWNYENCLQWNIKKF